MCDSARGIRMFAFLYGDGMCSHRPSRKSAHQETCKHKRATNKQTNKHPFEGRVSTRVFLSTCWYALSICCAPGLYSTCESWAPKFGCSQAGYFLEIFMFVNFHNVFSRFLKLKFVTNMLNMFEHFSDGWTISQNLLSSLTNLNTWQHFQTPIATSGLVHNS